MKGICTDFLKKYKFGEERITYISSIIEGYVKEGSSIIDIGCGQCKISRNLLDVGYDVTSIDIKNKSAVKEIKPVIFDGKKIPFEDNCFDASIIIAVLHHTKDPIGLIKEASRVSKHIVIMEDVYNNAFQKYLTYFFDSLVNLEFIDHPHSNMSDREWKKTFKKLKLKLIYTKYGNIFGVFNEAFYFLKKY